MELNIYTWIGLIGATILTFLPLVAKKEVTRGDRIGVIKNAIILVFVFIALLVFQMNLFFVIFLAILAAILLDRKTYTMKRFLLYTGIVTLIAIAATIFFRPNPSYILNQLVNHPEDTSLYIAIDGEPVVTYEDDVVRPLASVVKIVVALEYAHQVVEGVIDADTEVPLEDLDVYYVEGTDGGAHPSWKEEQVTDRTTVSLQEIAEGMVTYSSNANTDYLIDLLGAENIDARIEEYGITPHDPVVPLAGSLLVSLDEKRSSSANDWLEDFENIDDETYTAKAFAIHDQLKEGTFDTSGIEQLSIEEQRIWSDRLPGSTARAYGDLLGKIAIGDLDEEVHEIMHGLLQWPMEMVPENQQYYEAIGAKGGSTAFVLNQAMFFTTLDGTQYEIVLLTDDASFIQSLMISHNVNPFILEFINNEEFQAKVVEKFK